MKNFKILAILLSFGLSFYACNDKTETPKQDTTEQTQVEKPATKPNTTIPQPANVEPPQNENGVWHYTCSRGCPNGAGSATKCKNCGTVLAHNTAYHNKTSNTQTSAPFASPAAAAASTASTTPKTPEPSQNSAGVWHYTCNKGCAGGAGSAVACVSCGNTLAHNSAYH